ncbi:MAG TPA: hypothetical protein VFS20_02140 [Longimicrobium sp.]|nr:hypothetical protein [Longimicrobium sp.]
MPFLRSALALGIAAVAAAASPAMAQRVDPMKMIDLHVNAEQQNVSFAGTIPEGGKFRLTLTGSRQMYAISAVQRRENSFDVTVLRGQVSGADTTFTAIETVVATLGRPAPLRALPYFTVVIEGTRRADAAVSQVPTARPILATLTRGILNADDYCCVSCGGITACACRVQGSCGYCCVGTCCPKSLPEAMGPARDSAPLAQFGQRPCKAVPDSERLYARFRPASGSIAIRG